MAPSYKTYGEGGEDALRRPTTFNGAHAAVSSQANLGGSGAASGRRPSLQCAQGEQTRAAGMQEADDTQKARPLFEGSRARHAN